MKSKLFYGLIVFSRIFVGALFIVSGMVKANDPLGFSYKLEEYFSEAAFGWTFFEPYSLLMGILVSCGEMILGFAILFGGKPKLTVWLLLLLTVFFGFLTYYTATCNPTDTYKVLEEGKWIEKPIQCVTDCGCFGDALKGTIGRSLTPWESFYKDMILLFFVLILFIGQKRIKLNTFKEDGIILGGATLFLVLFAGYFFQWWYPVIFSLVCFAIYLLLKTRKQAWLKSEWTIALAISVASFGFAWYCYSYLPVKDFTPYAVGKSIPEGMKSAEQLGLQPPVYAVPYSMVNKKTGEAVTVRSDEWLANKKWQTDEWEIKSAGAQITVKDGYVPPIPALSFYYESDSGSVDIAQEIINNAQKPVLLLVMSNLQHAKTGKMDAINALHKKALSNGYLFYCATSAGFDEYNAFAKKYNSTFPFVNGDEQGILKPMVRSNPGLLLLKQGVIVGKWHYNTLPDFETVQELLKQN